MKRFFALAVVLIVAFAAAAWGQQGTGPGPEGRGMKGRGPMYDPAKTETVTGQVTEVREFSSRNGMREGIGLTLQSGDKQIHVHLGPKFYLDQQPVKIAKGDTVEITGVWSPRRQDVFVAGQVKKGNEVLKLHDETGRPMWAGQGRGQAGPGPAGASADQPKAQKKAPVGC